LRYKILIAEGDSHLLISSLGKIINRVNLNKVSSKWQLYLGFRKIIEFVKQIPVSIPFHMSFKDKVLEDWLENEVVSQTKIYNVLQWDGEIPQKLREDLFLLNNNDNQPLDGVLMDGAMTTHMFRMDTTLPWNNGSSYDEYKVIDVA
jgi:hypothetical protein